MFQGLGDLFPCLGDCSKSPRRIVPRPRRFVLRPRRIVPRPAINWWLFIFKKENVQYYVSLTEVTVVSVPTVQFTMKINVHLRYDGLFQM